MTPWIQIYCRSKVVDKNSKISKLNLVLELKLAKMVEGLVLVGREIVVERQLNHGKLCGWIACHMTPLNHWRKVGAHAYPRVK